ncbi:hypothetical protein BDQ12DRAFT_681082 [Crucibulum laeve]|uniref:ubiquitinyl hydrolase 1 n=1 Tax=Crucibulum laeve TaxID=68775 RepID=A0A5C3M4E7_9AGAR|nr:hypothetical protein BDQ12DRAFT_681082 [Crucibulum laeve]
MPGVTVLPNPPSLPPSGFGGSHTATTSNGAPKLMDDLPVRQLKALMVDTTKKEAATAAPLTMIRTAQTQLATGREREASGDLRTAFVYYIRAATLASRTMESQEFRQEKKGVGVLRKEFNNFFETGGEDLNNRLQLVEEKLKAIEEEKEREKEKARAASNVETNGGPVSVADRVRALQDSGLDIASSKRISRDLSNLPTPPHSPKNTTSPIQPTSASILSTLLPATPTIPIGPSSPSSTSLPSVFVPTSALGPPSPGSSPTMSPKSPANDLLAGFNRAFPALDELEESMLHSVPTGVSTGSNKSFKDLRNADSPASALASLRNFQVPMERPSSTPIASVLSQAGLRRRRSRLLLKHSELSGSGTAPKSGSYLPIGICNRIYATIYNVLLIDVREWAAFDREHIKASAVVCIESHVLRRSGRLYHLIDVNANMLEEATAVVPKHEVSLFSNRDNFDLVAAYDEDSTSFCSSISVLSVLIHKILKRNSMMLVGGINTSKLLQKPIQTPAPSTVTSASIVASSAPSPDPVYQVWTSRLRSDSNQSNGDSHRRPTNMHHAQVPCTIPLPTSPPMTNGAPSLSSHIIYIQFSRHISPTASGSGSGSPFTSQYDITSPPLASINPSQLSLRRNNFVDQSQEALSSLNSRPSIDYPELSTQQILRPPPAVASPVLERQDNRPRIQQVTSPSFSNGGPQPPRVGQDYPVTYWSDVQIGISGLKNLGNTCYMNAPIQCLSATAPFARFFNESRWKNAINYVNPLGSKGALTSSFASLVRDMWKQDLPYLQPAPFRKTICQLKSQYNGSEQHDSQEFLSFLIDGLHEDLNRVIAKPTWAPTPEQEAELERLPPQIASDREWRAWRMRNDSIIVDYFQGQFRNRLECLTCHQTSTTYNVFSILQLPISHSNSSKVHIKECLDMLLDEETLERDDAWDCPRCKTKRRASKKLSLARLPPILLISFKRFKFKGTFVDKVDTFVDFPMKAFDLTDYMPPPHPTGSDPSMPTSPDDPRTQIPPYRYELYGVTNHYGNLSSGHYTAFIASRGGWQYCDDSSVKTVDAKQVVNQKAYVLFYKRVRS